MGGNLVVTLIFNKERHRCRLSVMGLDTDGVAPAEDVLMALTSAADELKFQILKSCCGGAKMGSHVSAVA